MKFKGNCVLWAWWQEKLLDVHSKQTTCCSSWMKKTCYSFKFYIE
jgi:hypothetical protein